MATKNTSFNVYEMFLNLYSNDTVRKLVVNDSKNALNESVPQTPLSELILDRFFPVPKVPTTEEEKSTFICVYVKRVRKTSQGNIYYYENSLIIDIISHIDAWILDEGNVRPYVLMDEIDEIATTNSFKGINGILTPNNDIADIIVYNSKFYGYRMQYSFKDKSSRGSTC